MGGGQIGTRQSVSTFIPPASILLCAVACCGCGVIQARARVVEIIDASVWMKMMVVVVAVVEVASIAGVVEIHQ